MGLKELDETLKGSDASELLNKEIITLISVHTIFDKQRLWEIFQRVKSYDKLFCIVNMSMKFNCDLDSAEYYITEWGGGRFK